MQRRTFIILLGSIAAARFRVVAAQQAKMPKVGLLLPYAESEPQSKARVAAIQTSLQKLGLEDQRNVALVFRYSEGQLERLPAAVTDLIGANADVIVAAGTEATSAAQKA